MPLVCRGLLVVRSEGLWEESVDGSVRCRCGEESVSVGLRDDHLPRKSYSQSNWVFTRCCLYICRFVEQGLEQCVVSMKTAHTSSCAVLVVPARAAFSCLLSPVLSVSSSTTYSATTAAVVSTPLM